MHLTIDFLELDGWYRLVSWLDYCSDIIVGKDWLGSLISPSPLGLWLAALGPAVAARRPRPPRGHDAPGRSVAEVHVGEVVATFHVVP